MDLFFSEIIASRPFLIRGPDQGSFYVHSGLIAKHSEVLEKMVNGEMKESETREIHVDDVEGDIDDMTIVRFIQYAYTGDYAVTPCTGGFRDFVKKPESLREEAHSTPSPSNEAMCAASKYSKGIPFAQPKSRYKVKLPPQHSGPPHVEGQPRGVIFNGFEGLASSIASSEESDKKIKEPPHLFGTLLSTKTASTVPFGSSTGPGFSFGVAHTFESTARFEVRPLKLDTSEKRKRLWSAFVSEAMVKESKTWQPRSVPPMPGIADYTDDLICHAQLYVFSNRYSCVALSELTLQKLRLTLARFDAAWDKSAIIELIGYTYAHTQDHETDCDKLRSLVIDYTVCHLEKIAKETEFKELLRQEGAFADDLLTKSMDALD